MFLEVVKVFFVEVGMWRTTQGKEKSEGYFFFSCC
jgi:hypothetical protein